MSGLQKSWIRRSSALRESSTVSSLSLCDAKDAAKTGVVIYTKGQGPIFATHPLEKPYRG